MHKGKFYILIFVLIICSAVFLVTRNSAVAHDNQFGITENDSFAMSHFYNVNGVVGYEKKEFNEEEIQQILEFVSSLKYEKTLDINREADYGIPPDLEVDTQDSKIYFGLSSNKKIEVIIRDNNGNVLSDELYKTTARQLKKMLSIIGLTH